MADRGQFSPMKTSNPLLQSLFTRQPGRTTLLKLGFDFADTVIQAPRDSGLNVGNRDSEHIEAYLASKSLSAGVIH